MTAKLDITKCASDGSVVTSSEEPPFVQLDDSKPFPQVILYVECTSTAKYAQKHELIVRSVELPTPDTSRMNSCIIKEAKGNGDSGDSLSTVEIIMRVMNVAG